MASEISIRTPSSRHSRQRHWSPRRSPPHRPAGPNRAASARRQASRRGTATVMTARRRGCRRQWPSVKAKTLRKAPPSRFKRKRAMIVTSVRADAILEKSSNGMSRDETKSGGEIRSRCGLRLACLARRSSRCRQIPAAMPWEAISNSGIQTSLSWFAKARLIAKCRALAKPDCGCGVARG